jgi:hypothetical protein
MNELVCEPAHLPRVARYAFSAEDDRIQRPLSDNASGLS